MLREASTESVTAAARKSKPPAKAWWEHALAEGADLPTWVEAMMTVVGNTSWA